MPLLWATRFCTIADYFVNALSSLDDDCFGDFLAVMWECWNTRNRFIFKNTERKCNSLGKKAIDFVHSYRTSQAIETETSRQPVLYNATWSPPMSCTLKLRWCLGEL